MANLGLNVPGSGHVSAADIACTGARWARCVAYPWFDLGPWIGELRERKVRPVLVITSSSLEREGAPSRTFEEAAAFYQARYGGLTRGEFGVVFQLGNEPDAHWDRGNRFSAEHRRLEHPGSPSWMMDPPELNHLFAVFRQVMPDATLWGAGMCSGDPAYLDEVDHDPIDAVAVHPYAKTPENIRSFLFEDNGGYGRPGKELAITEFGCEARTEQELEHQRRYCGSMAQIMRRESRIRAALLFCYEDPMKPGAGMGMLDDQGRRKPVYDAFRMAVGRTIEQLEPTRPSIRDQLTEWRQALGGGEDPFNYSAFRTHLIAMGAGDPGPDEFVGFRC